MNENNYPAKFVKFRQRDFQSGRVPLNPPGPPIWFHESQKEIQRHIAQLIAQVNVVWESVDSSIREYVNGEKLPVPIVFKMKERALAKSHRPNILFESVQTDVIAVHGLGKLIVPVNRDILSDIKDLLQETLEVVPANRLEWIVNRRDKQGVSRPYVIPDKRREFELIHELTAIEEICTYTPADVLSSMRHQEYKNAAEDGKVKVRFFKFHDSTLDDLVVNTFIQQFHQLGVSKDNISRYGSSELNTYVIPFTDERSLEEMAKFPGVEIISAFMRFSVNYQVTDSRIESLPVITPDPAQSYPRVAVVDSGISNDNRHLKPWIEDVVQFVPDNRQDNYHGNFVGGLLIYGPTLNPGLSNVVDTGVKILDVVVIPDPNKEVIREDDLLNALIDALEQYSDEYKVWNLSLGTNVVCTGIVSDFTYALDKLQDEFDVQFVVAAGNYNEMRKVWPVTDPFESEEDRITIPADSVRAITVGAVALNGDSSTLVAAHEVVPYSRRGPGVGLSIKPDLVHYSGNPFSFPIKSVDNTGAVVSDYGTSFSTPLVSALLAEYYHLFPTNLTDSGKLSRVLARCLLVHGAKNRLTGKRIDEAQDHYYYGFGIPDRLENVLTGNEHEITLVLEGELNYRLGRNWIEVADFPFPPSLVTDDKIRGQILVTLAYQPHLNPRMGSEYSRSDIQLRLVTEIDGKYETVTKGSSAGAIPASDKWEKTQILKELKWSSVKQLEFVSPRGRKGSGHFKLELFPQWRDTTERRPLPFALAVTIRDPKGIAPVYNEVSSALASFQTADIVLRTPTRIVARS
jgi:serine protease AprX